jgi:hypothetical protein
LRRLFDDPWLFFGYLVCLIALVMPLWVSAYLPFMDAPQHLASIRIIHDFDHPPWAFQTYYNVDLGSSQYLLYYVSADWLASIMSIESANRVIMSLYVIGLPLSVSSYLSAHGRDPAVGLLAGPMAYNASLFVGFMNYMLALPMLFFGLALFRRLLDEWRPGRFVLLVVVTLALFFSHVQPFLIYGMGFGLTVLCCSHGFHPRHWWRQAAHIIPSLGLFLFWIIQSTVSGGASGLSDEGRSRLPPLEEMQFDSLLDRFGAIPAFFINVYHGDEDEIILLAIVAIAAVLLLFRDGTLRRAEVSKFGFRRAWLRQRMPEILAVAVFAVYFLSPRLYGWIFAVSHRLIPLVGLLALGVLSWSRLPRRRLFLIAPAVAVAIFASTVHIKNAHRFDEEVGGLRTLLADLEPGRRLMSVVYDQKSTILVTRPFMHMGQYYVVDRGGMAEFSFINYPQSPVHYLEGEEPPRQIQGIEWEPTFFDYSRDGEYFDYFLVRSDESRERIRPVGATSEDLALIGNEDRWYLYRRLERQ